MMQANRTPSDRAQTLLLTTILTLAVFVLASCSSRTVEGVGPGSAGLGSAATIADNPTPAEDGRRLFLENCAGCHGRNADGDTPAGRAWNVPDLRSLPVQSMSDQQLQQIIRQGRGKMPAWGGLLSQAEIDHLIAYMRSLGRTT